MRVIIQFQFNGANLTSECISIGSMLREADKICQYKEMVLINKFSAIN
ncbi:MAG: hypothetical protein R2942_02505 [Ignavibacteria bacterium]